jgi:hypothetical protein
VPWHLGGLQARDLRQHLARFVVDAVVPAQIAGIVIGDRFLYRRRGLKPTLGDQLSEELSVVDDLVGAPEIGVFVLERIEAVRAVHDDLRGADGVERFDVPPGQLLVKVFVSDPSGRVAVAQFPRSQDGERHSSPLEDLDDGPADLPGSLVE